VNAPAHTVLDAVRRPDGYPKFMRTLDEVVIVGGNQDALIYDWRWELGVLSFAGRNAMTVHRPPQDRVKEGYRITIDSQRGDLGAGRMLIRIVPRGERACTLVVSMRVDLRKANYVARQLARAARSINRSSNIALAYAMLLGFQREAEQRAGYSAKQRPKPTFGPPSYDLKTVAPLLLRGDLVLLDVSGTKLNHVSVIGLVHQAQPLVREVMLDAKAFGSSLMPGSSARVLSKEGDVTTFEWEIDLPLVGIEGTMRVHEREPIEVEAVEGALEGGRWAFSTRAVAKDATLVTAWADFDLTRSTWLLRGLIETDRNLGHGLSAASEVMLLRAVRSRARKHAEKLEAESKSRAQKSAR
jgi:hypothetical protein